MVATRIINQTKHKMSQQQFIIMTNVLLRVSVVSSHVCDGATLPDSGWLLLLWSLSLGPGSSACHVTLGPRHQPSPQRVTVTKRVGQTLQTRKTRYFCLQQDPKKSSMKTNHKPTILTKSPSLLLSQKKSIVFHGIWESTNPSSVKTNCSILSFSCVNFVFIFLFDEMELVDCTFCKPTKILNFMPTIWEHAENKLN